MLKRKILKTLFVLACIITLITPYTSTVLAVALTQEDTSAVLEVIRMHQGGEEASGTLTSQQQPLYDESPYGYQVGDTRIFKIITSGDVNYENTFYCLNAEKSFPGVTSSGYEPKAYTNVADLRDSADANVKALHLSTSNSDDATEWNANYRSLMWLIDNMYLPKQTPEQKDTYLEKAFADYEEYGLDVVKALLTDDDIDVVQQYAIWYFTNGDTAKYRPTTYPTVTLTGIDLSNPGNPVEKTGAYGDFTPANFPQELSYSLRQDFANALYQYLITAAKAAVATEDVTYPTIVTDLQTTQVPEKEGYYGVGVFRVNAGTASSAEYTLQVLDQNNEVVPKEDYKILIENETEFTDRDINDIFDTNYYIYIATDKTDITTLKLNLTYSSYETQATLWKNNETNSGVEIYQPLALLTRARTPHVQNVEYPIQKLRADLALRKYIVKVDNKTVSRTPTVDVTPLKNGSDTAEYKHAKDPVEVSQGSKVVYEIRVYNEGDIAGKAEAIYDALPTGLTLAENSSINETYGWEKVGEDGANRTVYKTEYLKDEEIAAFDKLGDALDSRFVQIECVVSDTAIPAAVLTNVAEIAVDNLDDDDSTPFTNNYVINDLDAKNYTGDVHNKTDLTDSNNYYKGIEDDDDFEKLVVAGKAFDLSLQKFITKVNKEAPSPSREPKVDVTPLKNGTDNNAKYTTVKTPVSVKKGDIVTYTIRVYNEGDIAGYAEEVADYLPEGLGFLVNHTTNVDNYWSIPQDSRVIKLSTIENGNTNLSIDDFNGVTDLSNVDVVVGKVKLTSTKLKSNTADESNLIAAFDKENGTTLSYKDIQVACIVLVDTAENNNLKNVAEVTKHLDKDKHDITDRDSTPGTVDPNNYPGSDANQDDHDYENLITEEPKEFDLSLQKFITGVNDKAISDRVPTISKNADGTLRYSHNSDALSVCYNDLVTFTIRVYNEGDLAGYAKEIVDYLPTTGLQYVTDNEINQKYGWKLYDTNGNETDNVEQATTARTNYLSKSVSQARNEDALLKPYDASADVSATNPDYKDVQIVFRVTGAVTSENKNAAASREYINTAEIYDDEDENGNLVDDRDSIPGNKQEGQDDIDKDKVTVKYFDLSLKKDLVKIIVTEDGTTREIDVSGTDALQKVEIHRKKINSTTVKFVYKITVTNEGEIAGYATEVKDYIPDGLQMVAAENPQWTLVSQNVATTNALAETLLEPGKSASVDITLQWINGENNFNLKTNVAEISADKNDSGTPDIDSTPNNQVKGEDDIDEAPVFLGISTGIVTPRYLVLSGVVLAILSTGIVLIKKYVL